MIDNNLISLIEEGVDYMYERCHHFNITISDKNDYKFIISSSIGYDYNKILKNKSYDKIKYTYFIGVKEDSNTFMQGLRYMEIIHEEPLYPYHMDSKQGSKMTAGEPSEAIKNAMSPHSDYKKGTWLDLREIWMDFKSKSGDILNENIMQKKISFWDDGTYKFVYSQDSLSEEHKRIIQNKIIHEEHKDSLNKIYDRATIECEYCWNYDKIRHDICFKAYHMPEIPQRYTINEYNISPRFDYIESLVKSDYLFDYK